MKLDAQIERDHIESLKSEFLNVKANVSKEIEEMSKSIDNKFMIIKAETNEIVKDFIQRHNNFELFVGENFSNVNSEIKAREKVIISDISTKFSQNQSYLQASVEEMKALINKSHDEHTEKISSVNIGLGSQIESMKKDIIQELENKFIEVNNDILRSTKIIGKESRHNYEIVKENLDSITERWNKHVVDLLNRQDIVKSSIFEQLSLNNVEISNWFDKAKEDINMQLENIDYKGKLLFESSLTEGRKYLDQSIEKLYGDFSNQLEVASVEVKQSLEISNKK